MNEKLVMAITEQINKELYSSYLYLSMSSWASNESWTGIANWLRVQSQEEMAHAMLLHDNLLERGELSIFKEIQMPKVSWESPYEIFEDVLKHEKFVTECINGLATIAMESNDHAFYQYIQWFVKEQVEEEATASDILARCKRLKDNPAMMDTLDKELATRVFVQPVIQ